LNCKQSDRPGLDLGLTVSACLLNLLARFLLGCDPVVDALVEDVERQSSGVEYLIVKGANLKLWPKGLFRAVAHFEDFQLARLVCQSLARKALQTNGPNPIKNVLPF